MEFLVIFLICFLVANVILLLIFNFKLRNRLEDFLLLLFSWGVAPFIMSLFFYVGIFLFPGKGDFFYKVLIGVFALAGGYFLNGKVRILANIYNKVFYGLLWRIKKLPIYITIISLFFISVYSTQLFIFPLAENDSAHYLNHAAAFYEYKNSNWQKESTTLIRKDDYFKYDSSVRPGIPVLVALSYMFQDQAVYRYAPFKAIVFYYYILLLMLFIFIIEKVSKKLGINERASVAVGLIFFVFSWGMSRILIFGAKEIVIYFFALFSLYIATRILEREHDRECGELTLLAILLGLNAFINLHGIIIESIILFLLIFFLRKRFLTKIYNIGYVFILSLFFGGFEFIHFFNFVFITPILNVAHLNTWVNDALAPQTITHHDLYDFSSSLSKYLKGKLQIFSNVGAFGVYFWLYIIVLLVFFKSVITEKFLQFLAAFILIYYIVVIDPFNLIKHPLSVVLWGSQKYAMLLLFLSMIGSSVFTPSLLKKTTDILQPKGKWIIVSCIVIIVITIFFKEIILGILMNILLATIVIHKDMSFYSEVMLSLYNTVLVMMGVFLCLAVIAVWCDSRKLMQSIFVCCGLMLILVPFFATNVGRVALVKTFSYTNASPEDKLRGLLNKGGIMDVYFEAKNILPRGTLLQTDYMEMYAYDDYFALTYSRNIPSVDYAISANCLSWRTIMTSGVVKLCERIK